jgi:hypothetical protein
MIIWGGQNNSFYFNTGGMLDTTNYWDSTTLINAPCPRVYHSAVWTGSKMIIWGGHNGAWLNDGGIYDPVTNTWSSISTENAPDPRFAHIAVWIGNKMIIWGGYGDTTWKNTGGIYDPVTNSWTTMSLTNAPCPREHHSAVWTGSKLIVWGGNSAFGESYNDGAKFDPLTNSWSPISSVNAPSSRFFHTAVWTGSKMIVWGGSFTSMELPLSSGGIYDPAADNWTPMDSISAPCARHFHSALWTGCQMIVWGGFVTGGEYFRNGGIYNPALNSWTSTDTSNAPSPRYNQSAVWTGSKMIIWGGCNPDIFNSVNTGGMYQNSIIITGIKNENKIPSGFSLHQNYPNPFNPSTTISYNLINTGHVRLSIFDVLGKEVSVLVNEKQSSGSYEVRWNASALPS